MINRIKRMAFKDLKYLFSCLLIIFLLANCSGPNNDVPEDNSSEKPEIKPVIKPEITIKNLSLGVDNSNQITLDSKFPISFEYKVTQKNDPITKISIKLSDNSDEIIHKEFEPSDTSNFKTEISLDSKKHLKRKDGKITVKLFLTSKTGLTKEIKKEINFRSFYIKNFRVVTTTKNGSEIENKISLNCSDTYFMFDDIHFNGNLKAAQLYFKNKKDNKISFRFPLEISDFKNLEEGYGFLYIPQDYFYDEKNNIQNVIPGNYNVFFEYETKEMRGFSAPILFKEDIKILEARTHYNINNIKISATEKFQNEDLNKFSLDKHNASFFIKGIKEIKLQNKDIRSIAILLFNNDKGEMTSSQKNIITRSTTEEELREYYKISHDMGKKDLSSYEISVIIDYNDIQEKIFLNKISRK